MKFDVKQEALSRLETITNTLEEVNPNIYKYFSEDKLYYSYLNCGILGSIDTISYDPKYEKIVREFEEKYSKLVYHVIETGRYLSLLYVTKPQENLNEEDLMEAWEYERLHKNEIVIAYVYDLNTDFAEFGDIWIKGHMGAIVRTR